MRETRQKADGGQLWLRQKIPNAPAKTSSEMNIALMAFSLNQISAVCLPLVSDNHKLIWVHSNDINLQLDDAAELDKAFDRFPYLTQKQTAALAERCSMHPDQVKVWFMVQRLCYGISWDYKDIRKVRRKFKSSREKEELHIRKGKEVKGARGQNKKSKGEVEEDRGHNKKSKGEMKARGGKKADEVGDEQSASEGRMMGKNVMDSKQLEEQPMKKGNDRKVEEDQVISTKKRKRMTVTDKMEKKKMKQREEGVVERTEEVEIRNDEAVRECQMGTTLFTRKEKKAKAKKRLLSNQEPPTHKSFVVPDEPLDASPPLLSQTQAFVVPPLTDNQTELLKPVEALPPSTSDIHITPVKSSVAGNTETQTRVAEPTNHNNAVTDFGKLKEFMEMLDTLVVADGLPTVAQQQDSRVDTCTFSSQKPLITKTPTQLAMMKAAFVHCQYPDKDDYDRLAIAINIRRMMLVKWFSDMRYSITKGRPPWMNQEQHSQALANICYRQLVRAAVKEPER